jgi:hypothetical protein
MNKKIESNKMMRDWIEKKIIQGKDKTQKKNQNNDDQIAYKN